MLAENEYLWDYDEIIEEGEGDAFEEALASCSLTPTGGVYTCGQAGSEDCDFTCPLRELIGSRVKKRRKR